MSIDPHVRRQAIRRIAPVMCTPGSPQNANPVVDRTHWPTPDKVEFLNLMMILRDLHLIPDHELRKYHDWIERLEIQFDLIRNYWD